MKDEIRKVECPACRALWYKVGGLDDSKYGRIGGSGPVEPSGDTVKCPECGKSFALVMTGPDQGKWREKRD